MYSAPTCGSAGANRRARRSCSCPWMWMATVRCSTRPMKTTRTATLQTRSACTTSGSWCRRWRPDADSAQVRVDYIAAHRPQLQIRPAPGRGNFKSPDIDLVGPFGVAVTGVVKGATDGIRITVHNLGTLAATQVQIHVKWLPFTLSAGSWRALPDPSPFNVPAVGITSLVVPWDLPASVKVGDVEAEHFCVRVEIDRYRDPAILRRKRSSSSTTGRSRTSTAPRSRSARRRNDPHGRDGDEPARPSRDLSIHHGSVGRRLSGLCGSRVAPPAAGRHASAGARVREPVGRSCIRRSSPRTSSASAHGRITSR